MRITLIGPGRAGLALALAARTSGHEIAAVVARRPDAAIEAASRLGDPPSLTIGAELPPCDLLMLAVRDDAIGDVAKAIAPTAGAADAVVHLSGLVPVDELAPLAERDIATGSFHPLQTIPTPAKGAERLAGAWIAITTRDEALRSRLGKLATSLRARPFDLADDAKPVYHAAAAAAANFPLVALAMAADLFEAADVPFEAAAPLVRAVIDNAFGIGPRSALTGPVARGDVGTVEAQVRAVAGVSPEWLSSFRALVGELALVTGRVEQFRHIVESEDRG